MPLREENQVALGLPWVKVNRVTPPWEAQFRLGRNHGPFLRISHTPGYGAAVIPTWRFATLPESQVVTELQLTLWHVCNVCNVL